jgi:HPt (histidine-containing phosphotransfer) domain-containing protein
VSTDDFNKRDRLLKELEKVRESFLLRTRGQLPVLRELLGRIQAGDSMGLVQLLSLAHRIHGSGATFDFTAISERAGQIEKLIEVLIGTDTSVASVINPHDLGSLMDYGRLLELEIGVASTQASSVYA